MTRNALDAEMDARLAERYRRALRASSDGHGQIQFDWLLMHVWLAMTDAVQAAYACANACRLIGGDGAEAFDDRVTRMWASVKRVLPSVLPLMQDFIELNAILKWRTEGGAERILANPDFLRRALEVGLPLSQADLLYATGPDGPAGKGAFSAISARVRAAIPA